MRAAILRWRSERASVSGAMGLADLARHAGALAEAIEPELNAPLAAQGRTISCAKGCSACCRQAVPLSPADVLLLSEAMEEMDSERRAGIEAGFRRIASALREAGMDEAPLIDQGRDYLALRLPCPFLADDACGVHSHRPLVCREHLVSSAAELCWDPFGVSVRMVDRSLSITETVGEMVGALLSGRELIPLARFPEWLAAFPEIRELSWEGSMLLDRLAAACLARLE